MLRAYLFFIYGVNTLYHKTFDLKDSQDEFNATLQFNASDCYPAHPLVFFCLSITNFYYNMCLEESIEGGVGVGEGDTTVVLPKQCHHLCHVFSHKGNF